MAEIIRAIKFTVNLTILNYMLNIGWQLTSPINETHPKEYVMIEAHCFLSYSQPLDQIPEKYANVLEEYQSIEPELFLFPWAAGIHPPVGTKIESFSMIGDGFMVDGYTYKIAVGGTTQVIIDVSTDKSSGDTDWPQLHYLYCLADTGFVFFDCKTPIRRAFQNAGLWEELKVEATRR